MSKKLVIMISGWAHSKDAMAPLSTFLARDCYVKAVSLIDLLSTGRKQAGGNSSPYALGLKELVNRCRVPPAIIGWSMGAIVALEACIKEQLNVGRIVGIAATARFCAAEGYPFGLDSQVVRAVKMGLSKKAADIMRGFLGDVASPYQLPDDLMEKQIASSLSMGIETLSHGLQYLNDTDLRGSLGSLKIPLLVINGRRDRIVPWQAGEFLSNNVPRGAFIPDDESGHNLVLTNPNGLASHIRKFLKAP
jgi:pimeloyl-[acyl-carrier protein] methyl ester esterase